MVTANALQQHPLIRTRPSLNAYTDLTTAPFDFVSTTPITAMAGNGHVTQVRNVDFNFDDQHNVLRIGLNAAGPSAIQRTAMVTPTRANQGAGLANRLNPVQQFGVGHGGSNLWITDQQTGCTFMVLDWGAGQYSAVHLLPHLTADFNRLNQFLFKSDLLQSAGKNAALKTDATRVVHATAGGGVAQPLRYIMVQSQFSLGRLSLVQVIGVVANGQWQFFRQENRYQHVHLRVHRAERLQWRNWSDWVYRTN